MGQQVEAEGWRLRGGAAGGGGLCCLIACCCCCRCLRLKMGVTGSAMGVPTVWAHAAVATPPQGCPMHREEDPAPAGEEGIQGD